MGDRLKGRIALVIGAGQTPGETVGNGRAVSIAYAREGAMVIATFSWRMRPSQVCLRGVEDLSNGSISTIQPYWNGSWRKSAVPSAAASAIAVAFHLRKIVLLASAGGAVAAPQRGQLGAGDGLQLRERGLQCIQAARGAQGRLGHLRQALL